MHRIVIATLATALLFPACTDDAGTDDFSGLSGLDEKSDAFSNRMKIVGSIAYGGDISVAYTKQPRFRAVTFHATAGDEVSLSIQYGDSCKAWILDNVFRIVQNVTTTDGFDFTTPVTGKYYIVMRTVELANDTFDLYLDGHAATTPFTTGPDGHVVVLGSRTAHSLAIDPTVVAALARATGIQHVATAIEAHAYTLRLADVEAALASTGELRALVRDAASGGPSTDPWWTTAAAHAAFNSDFRVDEIGTAEVFAVARDLVKGLELPQAKRSALDDALDPAVRAFASHGRIKAYKALWADQTTAPSHSSAVVSINRDSGEVRVIAARFAD